MERESFEDAGAAALLNKHYICVKVDREERPDVDHLYMTACVELTGDGGWPLTIFALPDKRPFFAGTYFPKTDRPGRMGLMSLSERLAGLWENERGRVLAAADGVMSLLEKSRPESRQSELTPDAARETAAALLRWYDDRYGGFGGAPKFPSPHNLLFLMRAARNEPEDSPSWRAVLGTLDGMARGGLRDHLGGGFFRYATDEKWLVPHFEKMLYDNALLLMAYTEAWQKTGSAACASIAHETAAFVRNEMTDAATGLFYTAFDADSEGGEGRYYLWTPGECEEILGDDSRRFCEVYGITAAGHVEGRSVPNLIKKKNSDPADPTLAECRQKLLAAREKRVKPALDDKALTTSNGLMAAALFKASKAFGREDYADAAVRALQFILQNMRSRDGGRLYAVWKGGVAGKAATLDGYAYLVWALLEGYAAQYRELWLDEAEKLAGQALELFAAPGGGLYYSGSDMDDLPLRSVNGHDGAEPSGVSVMAHNLIVLARLTGRHELEERAGTLIGSLAHDASSVPLGHTWLIAAHGRLADGGTDVVIADGAGAGKLAAELSDYRPFMTVRLRGEGDKRGGEPNYLRAVKPVEGRAAAYVCRGGSCSAPVTDPLDLRELLALGDEKDAGRGMGVV